MLGWFLETTLVALALAIAAALAGRSRSMGPTARHALWVVVLVKLVTPPLYCWPWAADRERFDWQSLWPTSTRQTVALSPDEPAPMRARALHGSSALIEVGGSPVDPSLAAGAMEKARDETPETSADVFASVRSVLFPAGLSNRLAGLSSAFFYVWILATLVIAVGQALRIIRFRARLCAAVPAPDFLIDEAEQIGEQLGVRVPEVLVVPDLGTPLVWCLGAPKLLLPAHLVKALSFDRWSPILAHELAHLRRGDHWVSRLELAAGLIWWWNPVYWLARARIDSEAELACDAWVIDAFPKQRLAYAETLFNIFSSLTATEPPVPALGAVGSGHLFERRLMMIVRGHASCRLSPTAFLAACFMVLLALPSWSTAGSATSGDKKTALASAVTAVDFVRYDDDASVAKAKADLKRAEASLRKALDDAKKAKADADKAKADRKKRDTEERDTEVGVEFDFSKFGEMIEKELGREFGPDFQKKMEEFGEKIEKELEGKFGPDFQKKMEEMGERIGKEIETKLGPGSEFEKKMKELGKDMEAKFGPGSEFEKKMKGLGKDMEAKFGPGSEFEKQIKQQAEKMAEAQKKIAKQLTPPGEPAEPGSAETAPKGPAVAKDRQRERRIAALEQQIRSLAEELKALKSDKNRE
jgi:beta-lactamase regulating signal transducer with metallopeptidase domain